MSASLVNHAIVVPGVAGGGTTPAINTTGANLLILIACTGAVAGGSLTPSDSFGNTWTLLSGSTLGAMWYSLNPTVGAGHTFTVTGSNFFPVICAQAFAGILGVDTGVSSSSSFSTQQTSQQLPAVTPNFFGDLLVTYTQESSNPSNHQINSGFTITDSATGVGGVNYAGGAAYLIKGANDKSAVSPTWSWTTSTGGGSAFITAFRATLPPPVILQTLIRRNIQDVIATIADQSNRSASNVYTTQLNFDGTLTIKLNGQPTWKVMRYGQGGALTDANPSHDFLELLSIGSGCVTIADTQMFLQGLT